ncbi:MAG: DUF4097 family beta strand repeat-containing protein [Acidobacteriota bacterium]
MLRHPVRALTGASAAVLLGAMLSACDITIGAAEVTLKEEKRFTVAGQASLDLSTFDGSIQVRGWDRNEVLVEVVKHGRDQAIVDQIAVSATQKNGTITIEVSRPAIAEAVTWGTSPSASLVVTAPIQSALVARSGDGSITLTRLAGKVELRTDDGSIRITEVKGDLMARTGDGSVRAEDFEGSADIETGDGSVSLEGIVRRLRLDTRDGSVQLRVREGSVMESDWSVTTGDGGMRIELPEGFSANLDATTGDGRIVIDDLRGGRPERAEEERATRSDEERSERARRSARIALGAGGRSLTLRSGDGTITVRRR